MIMITKLKLNVSVVADEVLAETALRHHLSADKEPVLSRDRFEALVLMIRASFARMCVRMMGCVVDCAFDDELLGVDVEHGPTASALTWATALQHALAMDVLGEALGGIDDKASEMYRRRSADLVEGVMRDVSMSGLPGARIVPSMF